MRRPRRPAWVLLAYLVAGVCFILALRGLSSPESSRRGNRIGMFGMAIAVGDDAWSIHHVGVDLAGDRSSRDRRSAARDRPRHRAQDRR